MTVVTPSADGSITVAQAALLCDVSEITIRSWISRGYVAPGGERVKLPVRYRYKGVIALDPVEVAKAEHATALRARRRIAA